LVFCWYFKRFSNYLKVIQGREDCIIYLRFIIKIRNQTKTHRPAVSHWQPLSQTHIKRFIANCHAIAATIAPKFTPVFRGIRVTTMASQQIWIVKMVSIRTRPYKYPVLCQIIPGLASMDSVCQVSTPIIS
jgi:hypothetical protein